VIGLATERPSGRTSALIALLIIVTIALYSASGWLLNICLL